MIGVNIICVGRLKESYLRDGCAEYIKRLSAFAKVQVIEIAEERCSDNPSDSEIKSVIEKEGSRIIAKIPKRKLCYSPCIEGKEYSSPDFSAEIEKLSMNFSSLTFLLSAAPSGLSDEIKNLGKMKLSFGKMTLPHQLARMVLFRANLQSIFHNQSF